MSKDQEEIWQNTRRIIRKRESWKNYWPLFVIGAIVIAAGVKLMIEYPRTWGFIGVVCIGIWGFHFVIRYWWIHSNAYVVDEDILKIRRGMIFRDRQEIPLRDIVRIEIVQTGKEKLLRVGALAIATKTENPACVISGISDPQDIRDHIYKVRDMLLLPQPERKLKNSGE